MSLNYPVSKIYWLWLPIIMIFIQIVIELSFSNNVLAKIHSENGPHELLQFLIMVCAFLVSAAILLKSDLIGKLWLKIWVGIATICCFYVSVEEVSWGQHFLEWGTPEYWANLNDQGETNIHNISSWLDQKPRILLEVGVVIGGLIIPAINKIKPNILPKEFTIIYPHPVLSITAGLFLILKIIDKAQDRNIFLFERVSEVQELYIFYFVLLYMFILRQRINNQQDH
ncbi:MAG: hypothetical protein GC137_03530 [Alphaproteobacteria bacterium]|nr:hypothetical protein [Alphaproteobacteria bacterium]